jgi:hypothetical protein
MALRPEHAPLYLYLDRTVPNCWIVRDRAGALESVPRHYPYVLGTAG